MDMIHMSWFRTSFAKTSLNNSSNVYVIIVFDNLGNLDPQDL
jgi:hypothetical protein